jgi:hypothetical protein
MFYKANVTGNSERRLQKLNHNIKNTYHELATTRASLALTMNQGKRIEKRQPLKLQKISS